MHFQNQSRVIDHFIFFSGYCIILCINLMLSAIFLPVMKSVCDLDIILSRKGLILLAFAVEANLYVTHKRDIGLQFFSKFLSLLNKVQKHQFLGSCYSSLI